MPATFDPEPTEEQREAILSALEAAPEDEGWAAAALAEGVEDGEPDP